MTKRRGRPAPNYEIWLCPLCARKARYNPLKPKGAQHSCPEPACAWVGQLPER